MVCSHLAHKPLIFVIDNAPDIAGFLPLAFQDHGYESRSVLTPTTSALNFSKLYVDPQIPFADFPDRHCDF